MPVAMRSRWIDTETAACAAQVHPTTLRRWSYRGDIRPARIGRRLVWNLDELADLRRVAVDNEIIDVHSEKSYWGGL
jgi:hypothetical protein